MENFTNLGYSSYLIDNKHIWVIRVWTVFMFAFAQERYDRNTKALGAQLQTGSRMFVVL